MNGNQLADILRYPKGREYQYSWYAGQRLPEEWWKTEFPYGEAERMGYKLSPEETRKFYERKKGKTLSEELADILKRPEVKMLDPLQRADLIDKVAKAQAVIAKREEEREKHEAEMLATGRETQLQNRVQAILESDRVPAQKVTALTMAGVPLSEARDMVWGKRAPEAEERPIREAAPAARPTPTGEELVEGLRPERARGVQFRMVGGELIKEPAGIWREEKLTPEQRIARREAELKTAEYYRQRALERKYPQLAIPLEERKFTAEEERKKREWEADVKEADRKYELDVEELGETKAKNLRTYSLDKLKEDHTWEESLFDMGFKDKEFNELSKQFWDTQSFNKEKEKTRAKEFDVDLEFDKAKEAAVMNRFDKELAQQYKKLDLDVKKFGLDEKIEARIAKMALFNFELDVKKYGLEGAIQKFKEAEAKKEWYWREKEWPLKETEALGKWKEVMHKITQDAKEFGLKEAIYNENIRQFDEKMKVEWKKLEDKGEAKIEIGGEFGIDLSGLGAELQNEVMVAIKSSYNPKTDKSFFPNMTQIDNVSGFLFGRAEGEKRSKEELGVNLPADEFIKKVMRQPMWSPELKGWCIRSRYNENVWQGICGAGATQGVYIAPGEPTKPSLWEKVTGWWPFGKEKQEPTKIDFTTIKTEVDAIYERTGSIVGVEKYLKDKGLTLDEYKEWLRGRK